MTSNYDYDYWHCFGYDQTGFLSLNGYWIWLWLIAFNLTLCASRLCHRSMLSNRGRTCLSDKVSLLPTMTTGYDYEYWQCSGYDHTGYLSNTGYWLWLWLFFLLPCVLLSCVIDLCERSISNRSGKVSRVTTFSTGYDYDDWLLWGNKLFRYSMLNFWEQTNQLTQFSHGSLTVLSWFFHGSLTGLSGFSQGSLDAAHM